jgi:protein-S-isoprenylcysteine O-methyltransferase Ste14
MENLTPWTVTIGTWVVWVVSWWMAAVWARRPVMRAGIGREGAHLLFTMGGAFMLFFWGTNPDMPATMLWRTPESAGWALAALTACGFLFCWWARVHLGSMWSSDVQLKEGHKIVDTGPYGLVRHPIYTGLLIAIVATAALKGTALGLLGGASMIFGIWLKARLEERFLRAELGQADYDAYARRVGMLVPGVGKKGA